MHAVSGSEGWPILTCSAAAVGTILLNLNPVTGNASALIESATLTFATVPTYSARLADMGVTDAVAHGVNVVRSSVSDKSTRVTSLDIVDGPSPKTRKAFVKNDQGDECDGLPHGYLRPALKMNEDLNLLMNTNVNKAIINHN